MAMRNLEIVVTVTDKASKQLDDVNKKIRGTGDAAQKAGTDFTKFNRTLFATTAFVGTFIKLFSSLMSSMDQGSELDRLSSQFERVLGPKGNLFQAIDSMTDASIDKFEAMRQGISLRSLGIVKSTEQLADVVSKAGVAAKMAGHDSGEGIKNYSEFLKDGNVSHLQFLNLISHTNPALQAQMAILHKAGGMMGGVISTQARLALGQSLLNAAVSGNLKGFRDLRDIMLDAKQNFSLFRQETGRLLLTALAPLIDKVSQFLLKMSMTIDNIRKNDKYLVFLTKTVVTVTGAVLGLAGALGTLRLATIALTSIGFGLPRLILFVTTLSMAFLGITNKVEKFTDKLRVFGAFVKGVWQLVTSLNTKTGIAQIDEDIKALLEKNGIMTFAQNVARAISVVKTVVKDMVDAFKWTARMMDNIFGGIGRNFIDLISKFKQPWENWWVNESATPIHKFARSFAVIGGTLGTMITGMIFKTILGSAGNLLAKIPIIGGLFGGRNGGGPKGSKSDPMYTRDADKSSISGGFLNNFIPNFNLSSIIQAFKDGIINIVMGFQIVKNLGIGELFGVLRTIINSVIGKFFAVTTAIAFVIGAFEGITNKAEEYGKFLTGLVDIGKAIFNVAYNVVKNSEFLSSAFEAAKTVLVDWPLEIFKMIKDGWRMIFELIGDLLGPLGTKFSKMAREISPETFQGGKAPFSPLVPKSEKKYDFLGIPDFNSNSLTSTAGQSGEKTQAILPESTDTTEDTIDMIGEQLKNVTGTQRKQMQASVENALRADSEGGKDITPDEMARIMGKSLNSAIDGSSVMQNIENNTRKAGNSITKPPRGN